MKKILAFILICYPILPVFGAGYVGTLPDIDGEFSHLKKDASKKSSAPFSVSELDKQNEKELKPIPRRNNDYVDIIVKKDKTSNYENDLNSIIIILEKLRKCLNTDQNIQMFNAAVSNLIDNVAYLRDEYKDKPESNYMSFKRLEELSSRAASAARMRMQARTTAAYIPYNSPDNLYKKETIEKSLDELLTDVNETLFILKNLE